MVDLWTDVLDMSLRGLASVGSCIPFSLPGEASLTEFLLLTLFLVKFVFEVDSERESKKECVGLDTGVLGERRGRGGVL